MPEAVIDIQAGWAQLYGGPVDLLSRMLTFRDPKREYNQAFKDGRWDGLVKLYEGQRFPAGHVADISAQLKQDGYNVRVQGQLRLKLDLSRFTPEYLGKYTLWPHQYAAALEMLTNPTGMIKAPTRSGKSFLAGAVMKYLWEEKGWRTLYVVPKKGLLDQTVRKLQDMYGHDLKVGKVGDGFRSIGQVTVGTGQTLGQFQARAAGGGIAMPDPVVEKLVREGHQILICDECHRSSNSTWQGIAMASPARVRYGMSGTPLKSKELDDARIIGATGPVIYSTEATTLIEAGLANKPKIVMLLPPETDEFDGKPYDETYRLCVSENEEHNQRVMDAVCQLVDHKRTVLLLTRMMKQFDTLSKMLEGQGISYRALFGGHSVEDRTAAKKLLERGAIKVLLATEILSEGEDVNGVGSIVLAEGVSSKVNAVQRIGRGMQRTKNGDFYVCDVVAPGSMMFGHAVDRCKAYEREGYEVRLIQAGEPLPFLEWDRVCT